jgi:hypothetical protein
MFLAALPITPYGLGTVQTAQVFLLSAYADAPTSRDRAATILAFSLVQYAASILTQAGLGALCWSRWTRGHEGRDIAGSLP